MVAAAVGGTRTLRFFILCPRVSASHALVNILAKPLTKQRARAECNMYYCHGDPTQTTYYTMNRARRVRPQLADDIAIGSDNSSDSDSSDARSTSEEEEEEVLPSP